MRLVLASANPDKAAEISAILSAAVPGLDLAPRPDGVPDVDETGTTLLENARLKAAAVAAATGEAAVADDTGLVVDALDGAPGVWSARFAGDGATYADNVAKLLRELEGVADRRARFRTVALVCFPDGREVAAEGTVDGTIATAPNPSTAGQQVTISGRLRGKRHAHAVVVLWRRLPRARHFHPTAGTRTDRKFLVLLPLDDSLRPRRRVVVFLHLLAERERFLRRQVFLQEAAELILVDEVPRPWS